MLAVSLLAIAFGGQLFATRQGQSSRLWLGIALVLGGVGALFAGASFQAFGHALKCVGRPMCQPFHVFEVVYNVLTVMSGGAAAVGLAHACAPRLVRACAVYAVVSSAVFAALSLYGTAAPLAFVVRFEFLVLALVPLGPLVAWLHRGRLDQPLDRALIAGHIGLVLTGVVYYGWLLAHLGEALWQQGVWLRDNDVFHAGMGLWLLWMGLRVGPLIRDA